MEGWRAVSSEVADGQNSEMSKSHLIAVKYFIFLYEIRNFGYNIFQACINIVLYNKQ